MDWQTILQERSSIVSSLHMKASVFIADRLLSLEQASRLLADLNQVHADQASVLAAMVAGGAGDDVIAASIKLDSDCRALNNAARRKLNAILTLTTAEFDCRPQ